MLQIKKKKKTGKMFSDVQGHKEMAKWGFKFSFSKILPTKGVSAFLPYHIFLARFQHNLIYKLTWKKNHPLDIVIKYKTLMNSSGKLFGNGYQIS